MYNPLQNINDQHIEHDGITTALQQLDHDIDERIRLEMLYIYNIKSILNQIITDLQPCVAEVANAATSLGQGNMETKLDAIASDINAERSKLNSMGPFADKDKMEESSNEISRTLGNYSVNLRTEQDRSINAPKKLGKNEVLFNTSPPPDVTHKFGGTRKRRSKYNRI
jgi:hypothetical protein